MANNQTKKTSKPATSSKSKAVGAPIPTSKEVAALLGVELSAPLKPAAVSRLRKALPGYAGLLDDVAKLLERDAEALGLSNITPEMLLEAQAEQKQLAEREAVAFTVYRSAFEQRMVVDDRAMKMLERLARRVNALAGEDRELPVRWKLLLDFLGTFRQGGGKKAVTPEAPAVDAAAVA